MNIENAVLRFPKNMSQNAKSLLKSVNNLKFL